MQLPGEMNLQGLALLGNVQPGAEGGMMMTTRMLDADGDGRADLFLVDLDSDGTIDGVIRGLDTDGDGINETFVQYDEDGSIAAVGRLDPETREFSVTYDDAEGFDGVVAAFGLTGLETPDDALFTTFDDPYIADTYGSFGDDVPDAFESEYLVANGEVSEVDETDTAAAGGGADVVDPADATAADTSAAGASTASDDSGTSTDPGATADSQASEGGEAPPEVVPRVVEIEDRSGAEDGSDLYAKVDTDADGLADTEDRLFKTSDGTWHGDINADGYSENVAFDHDMDGKIDSVDTTGQGSSSNVVDAERVVDPESSHIVDQHPGENDLKVEEERAAVDSGVAAADDDATSSFQVQDADDSGAPAAGADDAGDVSGGFSASDAGDTDDASAASSADDSASSYDSGSHSSSSDATDYSSTTTDSGSSGDDDGSTTT